MIQLLVRLLVQCPVLLVPQHTPLLPHRDPRHYRPKLLVRFPPQIFHPRSQVKALSRHLRTSQQNYRPLTHPPHHQGRPNCRPKPLVKYQQTFQQHFRVPTHQLPLRSHRQPIHPTLRVQRPVRLLHRQTLLLILPGPRNYRQKHRLKFQQQKFQQRRRVPTLLLHRYMPLQSHRQPTHPTLRVQRPVRLLHRLIPLSTLPGLRNCRPKLRVKSQAQRFQQRRRVPTLLLHRYSPQRKLRHTTLRSLL